MKQFLFFIRKEFLHVLRDSRTLFILFAVSARSLIREELQLNLPWKELLSRRWPVYCLYLLHLTAGIAYYIYAFVQEGYA